MKETREGKRKIILFIMAGVCALEVVRTWIHYFQMDYNLSNPLIPSTLIKRIANGAICITALYLILIVIALSAVFIKKLFWPAIVITVAGFVLIYYYTPYISAYFIEN